MTNGERAMKVKCPTCHVGPAKPCRRIDGVRAGEVRGSTHQTRIQASGREPRRPEYGHAGRLLRLFMQK